MAAPVDGSQLMANASTDMDPPAFHFSSDPVGCVAVNDYVAAGHFSSQVHPCCSLDANLSVSQSFGDPFDPAAVPLEDKRVVVGSGSVGVEKLPECFTSVSVKHLRGQDLVGGLFTNRRKSNGVDLDGHRGVVPESETKRHGKFALSEPMRRGG